jgi:hypothetical protein
MRLQGDPMVAFPNAYVLAARQIWLCELIVSHREIIDNRKLLATVKVLVNDNCSSEW